MGKGGGALSSWIKEFTTLVFTQAIQAFIYAIIISIILYGMVDSSGTSATDNNSALGLMSTFALVSVFKAEAMAKKIFGISDTKASPGSAMKSLAKTAIAAKLGKRVLDNAGKVTGGLRSVTKANQDNLKAKKRLDDDMKDEGFTLDKDGKLRKLPGTSGGSSSSGATSRNSQGNSSGGSSGGTLNSIGNSSDSNTTEMSGAAYRRMKNAVRNYEDKASEIKKARNEGVKSMLSGVSESVGALMVAPGIAVAGGADGDLDGLLNGFMAGAGIGDTIGKSAVDTIDKATQFIKRNAKGQSGISSKALEKSIGAYKSALSEATVNHHNSSSVDDI